MMPRHTGGGAGMQKPCACHRPGGGMIHNGTVLHQAFLKAVGPKKKKSALQCYRADSKSAKEQLSLCLYDTFFNRICQRIIV